MILADLHAQRRTDLAFVADAVRQLNEAELTGSPQMAALREYLARSLARLHRDGLVLVGTAECPACQRELPFDEVRGVCDRCKSAECAHESHYTPEEATDELDRD